MDLTLLHAKIFRAIAGGRVSPKGWIQGDCPFCSGRKKFGYHPEIGRYYCLKCGCRGQVGKRHANEFRPHPLPEVNVHLLGEERPSIDPPEGFRSFEDNLKDPRSKGTEIWNYALSRGITAEALLQSGSGYIWNTPDFAYRQRWVTPILDTNEKSWLGFVGRRHNGPPNDPWKYLYNRKFDRQTCLYHSQAVITPSTTDPIWVVEGAGDALYFWPHGVAVLGTYSPYQLYLLSQAGDRPIIVVLDGDAHRLGMKMALALEDLGAWVGCLRLPPKKDPDNMKYQWLYEEAMRSLELGLH